MTSSRRVRLGPPIDDEWRMQYRRRYLEDISDAELRQRGRDAFQNFMAINQSGNFAPLPFFEHERHPYWGERFMHVIEDQPETKSYPVIVLKMASRRG